MTILVDIAVSPTLEPGTPARTPFEIPKVCRRFVEDLIAEAEVACVLSRPDLPVPDVDWHAIWSAGDGEPSVELALGKIVTAAFDVANQISHGTVERFGPDQTDYWSQLAKSWGPPRAGTGISAMRALIPDAPPVPPTTSLETPEPRGGLAERERAPFAGGIFTQNRARSARLTRQRPQGESRLATHEGLFTGFTWVRNVGIVIVLFVAWQLWGTSISQHHEQSQLQSTFAAAVATNRAQHTSSSGPVLIPAGETVPVPAEGSQVAKLEIPAIALDEIVVSGTAEADLSKGPGHYIGTAAPGQAGNVAIAGHRTTNGAPFNRLGQLVIGDQIDLTTLSGERLTYVVSQPPTPVSPSDVTVLDDFGDNRITLTTCNPEFSAAQRLIVVGELKQPHPPKAGKTKPHPYRILNSQTASFNVPLLPVAVLEMGVLLLLGLSNRRFRAWYGGSARWFILVPLWGAGFYVLFGTLTMFLPSSI